jgi:hypothetical protein
VKSAYPHIFLFVFQQTPSQRKTMATQPRKPAAEKTAKKASKKAVVKKTVKKTTTKKAVKKTARKGPARKAAKKAAPPRTKKPTTIIARIDAGFGNGVYLRGNGAGLSWTRGALMENTGIDEWVWESDDVEGELEFKVLINDEQWSAGQNGVVFPGATVVFEPTF